MPNEKAEALKKELDRIIDQWAAELLNSRLQGKGDSAGPKPRGLWDRVKSGFHWLLSGDTTANPYYYKNRFGDYLGATESVRGISLSEYSLARSVTEGAEQRALTELNENPDMEKLKLYRIVRQAVGDLKSQMHVLIDRIFSDPAKPDRPQGPKTGPVDSSRVLEPKSENPEKPASEPAKPKTEKPAPKPKAEKPAEKPASKQSETPPSETKIEIDREVLVADKGKPVERLNLDKPVLDKLKNSGINSIGDVLKKSRDEMTSLVGEEGLQDILNSLAAYKKEEVAKEEPRKEPKEDLKEKYNSSMRIFMDSNKLKGNWRSVPTHLLILDEEKLLDNMRELFENLKDKIPEDRQIKIGNAIDNMSHETIRNIIDYVKPDSRGRSRFLDSFELGTDEISQETKRIFGRDFSSEEEKYLRKKIEDMFGDDD